jgi:hypothetical protein
LEKIMAFEPQYLAGGLIEHMDDGTLAYKRVLAIRASVLATTDLAHQTAFDAAFEAQFGFTELSGMQRHPAREQERIVMWARMNLIEQRADFNAVALPAYAAEKYFYSFYQNGWLHLDERMLWTIVAWTERWAAIELRGVLAATIDNLLLNSRVLQFGLESAITAPSHQVKVAASLIRIAGTGYDAIVNAADDQLEFNVDEVATRMRDRNYLTHLHMMGWYAEGLQTILLADERAAFNAVTQTDWGDEAVDKLNTEMVALMQRLGTMGGTSPAIYHDILIAQAEMTAHGYVPEALFQLIGYLPGESGIDVQGAIWVEFPAVQANQKTLSCSLKILVPEGVTITDLEFELVHNYANALFTRYANADNDAAVDADTFTVANADVLGVGQTQFVMNSVAGLTGLAGGTVFELGTFDLHYLAIGSPSVELSPRPYWMDPQISLAENGGADISGNFFGKGLRMMSGLKNDGGRNYLFPEMEEGLVSP